MADTAADSRFTTSTVARETDYSPGQVRKLEQLGVIPPAARAANGYRLFSPTHVRALRAYRLLATAVGPVAARRALSELWTNTPDDATAHISQLHIELTRERAEALAAQRALRLIHGEASDDTSRDDDSMTIRQLAEALNVRASTLRFWEQAGLIEPTRVTSRKVRSYPPETVQHARIVAALRHAGYRIPEIHQTMRDVRALDNVDAPIDALQNRLATIAARTRALLRAGTDIVALLDSNENH